MDAFSLALIYGTQGITKKDKLLLSLIVGVYHFIMPLIGVIIGNLITSKILINTNILVGIILSLIAVEMIISSFKETNNKFLLTFPSYLIFGLSVSIDSLTTGVGLSVITDKYILSSIIFAFTSLIFTYLGLNLGDKLNKKYPGNVYAIKRDSLTTGIGLSLITKNCIFSSTVFCVTSMLFTYLGLNLGDTLNRKYGKISTILGGMVLFILGFLYILK